MVPSSSAERVLARSTQVATTIARVLGSPIARWNVAYCAAVMGAVGGVACWGAQASSGPAASRRAKVVTRRTGDPPGLGRAWCLIGALPRQFPRQLMDCQMPRRSRTLRYCTPRSLQVDACPRALPAALLSADVREMRYWG